MKNSVIAVALLALGLSACGGGTESSITVSDPTSELDCRKLDPNSADYPAECKNVETDPPPPPPPCQYSPCEGDAVPVVE